MSNELIVLPPAQYPALDPNNDRVKLMQQNLGGESLSPADLGRIKVPPGGGTKWVVQTPGGEEYRENLDAVILYTTTRRAYWSNPNPSESPPDCFSVDLVHGEGTPGGLCQACPFAQWGSAANHHGQACKTARLCFLLREGKVLPEVLSIPPGSLKIARKYLIGLTDSGLGCFRVVTRFGLQQTKNRDGISYSQVTLKMVGRLDDATATAVFETAKRYAALFQAMSVQSTDVNGDGETQEA